MHSALPCHSAQPVTSTRAKNLLTCREMTLQMFLLETQQLTVEIQQWRVHQNSEKRAAVENVERRRWFNAKKTNVTTRRLIRRCFIESEYLDTQGGCE